MRVTCAITNIYKLICFFKLVFAVIFIKSTKRPRLHDSFHSNVLSAMHGFRDNEVLLQSGYDVVVISPSGGASRYFI